MWAFVNLSFVVALLPSYILANPVATPAPELQHLNKRACAADNCLRGFRNRIQTAVPFCETYTTQTSATLPTWAAAACATNPTRVSSACSCLETSALTKVYGPTDNTNYTIFSQAENIRSDPGEAPDEYFNNCYTMCSYYGARCQTFSFAQMPNYLNEPGGLYLCYIYTTLFQPGLVQTAVNWTGNVVYQRV